MRGPSQPPSWCDAQTRGASEVQLSCPTAPRHVMATGHRERRAGSEWSGWPPRERRPRLHRHSASSWKAGRGPVPPVVRKTHLSIGAVPTQLLQPGLLAFRLGGPVESPALRQQRTVLVDSDWTYNSDGLGGRGSGSPLVAFAGGGPPERSRIPATSNQHPPKVRSGPAQRRNRCPRHPAAAALRRTPSTA